MALAFVKMYAKFLAAAAVPCGYKQRPNWAGIWKFTLGFSHTTNLLSSVPKMITQAIHHTRPYPGCQLVGQCFHVMYLSDVSVKQFLFQLDLARVWELMYHVAESEIIQMSIISCQVCWASVKNAGTVQACKMKCCKTDLIVITDGGKDVVMLALCCCPCVPCICSDLYVTLMKTWTVAGSIIALTIRQAERPYQRLSSCPARNIVHGVLVAVSQARRSLVSFSQLCMTQL